MSKLRVVLVSTLFVTAAGASFAEDGAAWAVLDTARKSLAASGPERAEFVQTYVPAGFSSGEEEAGRIAFRLPDCLRWDYDEPYPKSFLVCGERVYSWNPEDRRGQTAAVDRESQPGLDLLLLPVDELSGRYDAKAEDAGAGRVAVHLEPRAGMAGQTELTGATLVVDTRSDRLVEVSYQDREGNRTTFRITGYEALPDRSVFDPPDGISWEEG
ncbi:MAG TPA: outer membrane lipoprotein carrier protein LolA [Thermoanaerobaculia bacterium]|nr:outer membrane lipoprotein carrier protein LolA [Thermoanaerobaculia bacterium]